ncbi:SusC/RagA family TonB-linked outer membrane protein [Robertkochia solimangrovi]|uniref:SusC/RagA family TonB-linked outer membrane protein n=1 Tax=Robertkochia solimangrovi TaxID=2213046 RepID=UPI00117DE30D|nr:TonB-dependent receptor [Robertkochia solimangrovi]TRZ43549.1 TonB-dependent receptor [Robertkochia solimangrovi]
MKADLKKVILVITFFITQVMFAQINVTGKISDASKVPLPGVTIMEAGTGNGTTSDFDGNYSLIVSSENAVLIFSYIGFESQEVTVGNQSTINISLEENQELLDEVVVVGYGQMKKSDLTGAVSSINAEQLERFPKTNAADALQGQISGLNIRANSSDAEGSGTTIQIRGQNSISASNSPLIILDGIPYYGNLSEINPVDIQSMDVLKDASSTAIYGSRGANGVILITTKKGKTGKPVITYDTFYRLDAVGYYPKMMDGQRFGDAKVEYGEPLTNIEQKNYDNGHTTDWMDIATRTGSSVQHNFSIRGASERSSYYISAGINDNKGIVVGDSFKRISLRTNVETKITDWITFGTTTQIGFYDRDGIAADVDKAFNSNPLGDAYNEDGSYTLDSWEDAFWAANPMADTNAKNNNDTWRIITNNFFDIKIPFIEGLSYRLNVGYNYSHRQYERYYGMDTRTGNRVNGELYNSYQYDKDWVVENIMSYNRTFGKHKLFLTGLYSVQENSYQFNTITGRGFPNDLLGYYQQSNANALSGNSDYSQRNYISQMFRSNYTYDDRYLLTFTIRRDGYSGFGQNNKFGVFPSFAVGWNLSNESFMENSRSLDFISQLKLRLSYGENGNEAIAPYSSLAPLYPKANLDEEHQTAVGYYPEKLGNPALSWETTRSFNVGTDFSLWKNRISANIDVYFSKTTDLLLNRTIPALNGTDQITENVGETRNNGLEITLNTINVDKNDFQWRTNFVFSKYRTEIVNVGLTDDNGNYIDDVASRWFIGQPINVNYDYMIDGVWQVEDFEDPTIPDTMKEGYRPGDMRYRDVDGDGDVDTSDQTIIGSAVPSFTAGLTNIMTYKNFSFSFFLNSIVGIDRRNPILNNFIPQLENVYDVVDYWREDNTNTIYPKNTPGSNKYDTDYFDSATFVRLQDITLSYDFDKALLEKIGLDNLQVYINLRNVHTWTDWIGVDPEHVSNQGNPMPKSYLMGLKVSL